MRLILILTMLFGLTQARAQAPAQNMTAADVEAFLDGVMPLQIEREDIAGAVIVVVKDGKILFTKGYGFSDVAKRTPVTPDATLFRPGSISKLFTWTSIMQLVEQKKLDLDRDVNDYLDFKIPATYPKPITLRNIMTHTPGFEEVIKDLIITDQKRLVPLGDYIKASLPNRVYPPGTIPAYSNYATAMAGYILQRVSGEPFRRLRGAPYPAAAGHVAHDVRQPLPPALQPLMSKGYAVASKPPKPFEFVQAWPAGSSSLTATDIAKFMIMHLQDGKYENVQILQPETARLMHSAQFVAVPPMNSMCLGFYEESRNGQRIIGHGGDTGWFHSDLHLIPAANIGFFVSYNSAGKGQINPRGAVWEKFLDRYFPYQVPDADDALHRRGGHARGFRQLSFEPPPGDHRPLVYFRGKRHQNFRQPRRHHQLGRPRSGRPAETFRGDRAHGVSRGAWAGSHRLQEGCRRPLDHGDGLPVHGSAAGALG